MTEDCKYCHPSEHNLVLELGEARLLLPDSPHIAPGEGGHLVVATVAHVADRRAFRPLETLTVNLLTVVAADALRAVFDADWQNFQENGNWCPNPEAGHAHVHVYGRRRGAIAQPFGEALRFPLRSDRSGWEVPSPTGDQVDRLRAVARRLCDGHPEFDRAIEAVRQLPG